MKMKITDAMREQALREYSRLLGRYGWNRILRHLAKIYPAIWLRVESGCQ
jgi:hypothetical protein